MVPFLKTQQQITDAQQCRGTGFIHEGIHGIYGKH